MKILIYFAFALLIPAVLSQGWGCEDGDLPDDDRVDCYPEPGSNEAACRARNCTWCEAHIPDQGTPWCFFPGTPSAGGYVMVGQPEVLPNGFRVNLARAVPESANAMSSRPYWDGEAEILTLNADFQSDSRLRIKITDEVPRWEVPLKINPPTEGNSNLLYDMEFSNDPLFSFRVIRKSTGAVLINAGGATGKFIFADQYITLSWKPPTENVYGLGENEQHTFKHDFSRDLTWALWGRDQAPDFTANMYGVQPYYTVLEADGKAHSVAIVNSNAQQFTMKSGPLVQYTTIGGLLDFYIFLGPTPENTVQQYTQAVGRAQMPPYWALGFQLCRYGYNSIENMKTAVDRTAQYQIPHDVQYGDIDIMERALDFTYSRDRFAGLPEYVKELKTKGIKFLTILDPCISIGEPPGSYRPFEYGEQEDVWMKRADGTNAVGRVWPNDPIYFPDYSNPKTREWWITLIKEFHDLLEYDGLWIDMNEPANFVSGDVAGCTTNQWNNPPFVPRIRGGYLPSATACADHKEFAGKHYDTHSLYGWFQSEPTLTGTRAGTGKRALVLSRSTFLGSGHWVAHWLGDNFSRWNNLHYSIIGMLQYNQFGVPFVGADICGFIGDSNADMCQRWMELGAFYPFARNHNGINNREQDPGAFGAEVAESSRKALLVRYTLLPYLYTLFYQHHISGNTVVRALWHEFPTDANTIGIDRQFMWGSGLIISPVLDEHMQEVSAYFPTARIYDYFSGGEIMTKGEYSTIPAPKDFIPVHVRGGNILPTQVPAINTEVSRNNPFGLIIALDESGSAQGGLYYDDGDSLDPVENGAYFYSTFATGASRTLLSTVVHNGYPGMASKTIDTVRLLGAGTVTSVTVNGVPHTEFVSLPSGEVLLTNLRLRADLSFIIRY